MKKIASATDPLWYKDAIIYELHVRAFSDSNNDGIGDFPGLDVESWIICRTSESPASGFCLSSLLHCAMTGTISRITSM